MFQTINALVSLIQKWHNSMDEMYRVINIVLFDIRKAFDLINHNRLSGNLKKGYKSSLVEWYASYLNERCHFKQFGKDAYDFDNVAGDVPHSCG